MKLGLEQIFTKDTINADDVIRIPVSRLTVPLRATYEISGKSPLRS